LEQGCSITINEWELKQNSLGEQSESQDRRTVSFRIVEEGLRRGTQLQMLGL